MSLFPRIREELAKRDMGDVLLTGGGIIPEEDMVALESDGFAKLFGPGTATTAIADWIHETMQARWAKEA